MTASVAWLFALVAVTMTSLEFTRTRVRPIPPLGSLRAARSRILHRSTTYARPVVWPQSLPARQLLHGCGARTGRGRARCAGRRRAPFQVFLSYHDVAVLGGGASRHLARSVVDTSEGQHGRSGTHEGAAHRPTQESRINESRQQRFALYPVELPQTLYVFKREAELGRVNVLALNSPHDHIDARQRALGGSSLQRRRAAIVALCQGRLDEIPCWHTFSGADTSQL